jgi:dihydrodipicolinate synthase/N-acetylneuraminate lyase
VVPQVWVDLYQSIAGGDYQQARSNFAGYFQLFKHIFQEPNPVPLKYLMQQLGTDSGRMSFPLGKPSDALQQLLKDDIQRLGLYQAVLHGFQFRAWQQSRISAGCSLMYCRKVGNEEVK